jgi:hypothetical protein
MRSYLDDDLQPDEVLIPTAQRLPGLLSPGEAT